MASDRRSGSRGDEPAAERPSDGDRGDGGDSGNRGDRGDRGEKCPVRHCWVTEPADGGVPRPGLLLEWRRDERTGWLGRVVYGAELRPGIWAAVEEWLPADLLSTA